MTISELTTSDIIDRCEAGGEMTHEQARRMREIVQASEWAETPTADIPEREWLRMLTEACEEPTAATTSNERFEFNNFEDAIEIRWNGEQREVRTYTKGTSDALYVGDSLDAAADSLDISRADLDYVLSNVVPVVTE